MEELGSQAEAQSSLRLVPVPGGQCSVGSKKGPRDWTDPELDWPGPCHLGDVALGQWHTEEETISSVSCASDFLLCCHFYALILEEREGLLSSDLAFYGCRPSQTGRTSYEEVGIHTPALR